MVDPLGGIILLSSLIYVFCIYIGYYILEDFNGIIAGTAVATATLYLLRNLILGAVTGVVSG